MFEPLIEQMFFLFRSFSICQHTNFVFTLYNELQKYNNFLFNSGKDRLTSNVKSVTLKMTLNPIEIPSFSKRKPWKFHDELVQNAYHV